MNVIPLADDRRAELFQIYSLNALVHYDEAGWNSNLVVGRPTGIFEASGPDLTVLLNRGRLEISRFNTVSGFAVRVVFPAACNLRVFNDAVLFLHGAMDHPPGVTMMFVAEQGGRQLFELHLLVQGEYV